MKYFSHKMCRRYGVKLCQSEKCPLQRRNMPPGVHGPKGRGRVTQFGMQLAEKQKAKATYNLRERQFRQYYEKAINMKGDTGLNLIQLLEKRLDNVVYRAGFAKTRAHARQLVNHSFFFVNGKRVNIPSFQVSTKDALTIKPSKESAKVFEGLEERLKKIVAPSWFTLNIGERKAVITGAPKADEAEQTFNPRSIVEFYSK